MTELENQDATERIQYLSPVEMIIERIRLPPELTCGLVPVAMCTVFLVLSFFSGETNHLSTGIKVVTYSSSIAVLMYGEYWIGNNIRKSLDDITRVFSLSSNVKKEILQETHKINRRIGSGLIFSVIFILLLYYLGPRQIYLPLILYGYAIGAALGFMFGELLPGVKAILDGAIKIGKALEERIDILDMEKLDALKNLAGWGLHISIFGAFVALVSLVGIVYTPWSGATFDSTLIATAVLIITSMFIIWSFINPTLGIHEKMQKAKKVMKIDVSKMYQSVYNETRDLHREGNLLGNIDQTNALYALTETIERMKTRVERAPEWPFNMRQIQKVIGTSLVPIVVVIIQNIPLISSVLGFD